jgi:hypothetical protein
MVMFKLGWNDFVDKVQKWNITPMSLIKIIVEEHPDMFIFFLPLGEADYCCAINKADLSPVDRMNILAISVRGELVTSVEGAQPAPKQAQPVFQNNANK